MQERLQYSFDALDDSLKRIGTYPEDNRFAPLAETLLWIDLIDTAFLSDGDKYKEARDTWELGPVVRGLRYARNRLTHDVTVYGMHGLKYELGAFSSGLSEGFDIGTPTWRWRIVDDLPPYTWSDKATLEPLYQEHLEGKEVEPTLNDGANFLRLYRAGWVPPSSEEE